MPPREVGPDPVLVELGPGLGAGLGLGLVEGALVADLGLSLVEVVLVAGLGLGLGPSKSPPMALVLA